MSSYPMQFSQPPRNVPLALRVANLFNAGSQIGWAVFGFGMIFFWGFVANADLSFLNFRGPHAQAIGRVTSVEPTGASVNKRRVLAHHYKYPVAGNSLTGSSYSHMQELQPGDVVTVEYDPADPARSRIEGMRRRMFGPVVLLVAIFPLVGLIILIGSTAMGRKRIQLLRDGIFTTGTLKSKSATNMRVNRRTVFALTFEFTARDGRRHEMEATSSTPDRLEDEAQEPLLYDPENPAKAFLLDDAPSRPKMEMNGDLTGNPSAAFASLILPSLVTGANLLFLLYRFGKH
jgi:hypothetical protein